MDIAVFLGPSLPVARAETILKASYHAPAKMGDVYRILASGVKTIVLIDGLFHQNASIWHRELMEALENGVEVIGASSMGALRAAELQPFGMKGYGRVFEWYDSGFLDGDDEVALLHAGEEHGYKAFSDPLVNIRHSLLQAVQHRLIRPEQEQALLHIAKNTVYSARTYQMLLESDECKAWSSAKKQTLIQFLKKESHNLKQQDALGVLHHCAQKAPYPGLAIPVEYPVETRSVFHSTAQLRRGFFLENGKRLNGIDILNLAGQDQCLWAKLRSQVIKDFFLLSWMEQHNRRCPSWFLQKEQQLWKNRFVRQQLPQWQQENGLTPLECERTLNTKIELNWLQKKLPKAIESELPAFHQYIQPLLEHASPIEKKQLAREIQEICFLNHWAETNGVSCPMAEIDQLKKGKHDYRPDHEKVFKYWATHDWMIQKGPVYFGYASWSLEGAVLRELQFSGKAATLANQLISQEEH